MKIIKSLTLYVLSNNLIYFTFLHKYYILTIFGPFFDLTLTFDNYLTCSGVIICVGRLIHITILYIEVFSSMPMSISSINTQNHNQFLISIELQMKNLLLSLSMGLWEISPRYNDGLQFTYSFDFHNPYTAKHIY